MKDIFPVPHDSNIYFLSKEIISRFIKQISGLGYFLNIILWSFDIELTNVKM